SWNRSTVVSTPARCRPRPCAPPRRSRPTPRNCAGAPRRRRRSTARVLEAHDRDRRNPPLGCEPRERRVVVRISRSCTAAKVVARTVQKVRHGPSRLHRPSFRRSRLLMADGAASPAFLGVSRSLSGRAWRQRPAEATTIRAHMQTLGLDEPLARALAARKVAGEQGADFLKPTLKALFPDPSSFMDMDAAAVAIVDALQAQASVHVFADYDVDGASSAALLVRWFRALGADLPIYVP